MLVENPLDMILGVERPKDCRFFLKLAKKEGFFEGLHEVYRHELESSIEFHEYRQWGLFLQVLAQGTRDL